MKEISALLDLERKQGSILLSRRTHEHTSTCRLLHSWVSMGMMMTMMMIATTQNQIGNSVHVHAFVPSMLTRHVCNVRNSQPLGFVNENGRRRLGLHSLAAASSTQTQTPGGEPEKETAASSKDDYDEQSQDESKEQDVDVTEEYTDSSEYADNSGSTQTNLNIGQWEEMHGNYLLRPPQSTPYATEPRALIHFLGGAIVGAAPDISYRYILERLSQKGFLIVATPFTLSFDYISTCDDIIGRFERIAPTLARQFGPVPVVGVGHSCGALLQLLITTLFPDTPRAANALLSYNNKSVKEAVPFFDEFFAPLFATLGQNGTGLMLEPFMGRDYPSSSADMINMSILLSRSLVKGTIPSDEVLSDIAKRTTPKPLSSIVPQQIQIPSIMRESIEQLLEPIAKANTDAGISPLFNQAFDVLEQIPSLIEEVADGARDFNPTPASVRASARRAYRARRTLLIQYDDDPLDESEEIESLLNEAENVMRMKRPMVNFDIKRTVLNGGHATPCFAPPLDLATKAEDLLGEDSAKNKLMYKQADDTVNELVRWLEEGNL
mmetsp:Transcript_11783/g.14665  ORF Transcript_11783/g.14665 Transcript_11783/m.14665 type:complete len:551 (-) Transcript_11783:227-1879(-)